MKRTILSLLVLISGFSALSQPTFNIPFDTLYQLCPPDSTFLYMYADSGNSTNYTYDVIPYNTEPVGGTSLASFDDQVHGPFNIGFQFSYFCGTYSQFYIGSNGWIGFSSGQTATWVVTAIPNTGAGTPKNCIMGPWRDWHPGTGSNGPYIKYQTLGTAPLRKLVVTWSNVPMYGCTSTSGTFQIVLHEASNIIHNNLTNVPVCLTWGNGDGTEGVHNSTGSVGVAVTGRNDSQFTVTNQSVRFIPTSPIVWTTLAGAPISIGNGVYFPATTPTWVLATGTTCSGDTLQDSVFVNVSCVFLDMDSVDVDCTGDPTGVAIATDTSSISTGPYTFYWKDFTGDTIEINNSNDSIDSLTNVPAGVYTVIAVAANNEFAVGTITVNEPDTIFSANVGFEPVICNGESTGLAFATDTNDYSNLFWDGTYSFYWESGGSSVSSSIAQSSNTDTAFFLAAGTYDVTVDGCFIQVDDITVTQPALLTASTSNPGKTSCPGGLTCDASATASGTGGISPYTFLWPSNETTPVASQLCAGYNVVTVTDANGCDTTATTFIDIPDSIVTLTFGDTMICITNPAAIAASSTGGTPPFSYIWRLGKDTSDSVVSLLANDVVYPHVTTRYFVSSTDDNNCPGDTGSVLIKVRPPLGVILPHVDTICPYDTIDILAQGVGGDSIYSFTWSGGAFGPTFAASPDLPSWIAVTVGDLCGTPTFTDSVFVQVGGYSPINAKIRIEDDSLCVGESVYLIASGRGGFKGPEEYRFKWDKSAWDGNPVQFAMPLKTTQYIVTISDLCLSPSGTDTVTIYVGQPEVPEFKADPTISCSDATVIISIDTVKEHYNYDWNLGDGDMVYNAQDEKIEHEYDAPGCYDVTLSVVTDFGCVGDRTEKCFIQILESPKADFKHTPVNPTTLEPIVQFEDRSEQAASIQWMLDNTTLSTDPVLKYEFIDTGYYQVDLVAYSADGCTDTISQLLHHSVATTIYLPMSFSPNGDGLNDVFKVVGEGISLDGFEIQIFDRWGQPLFYSKNPDFGWDGKMAPGGEFVPAGSYSYIVRYIDRYNEPKKFTGHVIVSKTGHASGLK